MLAVRELIDDEDLRVSFPVEVRFTAPDDIPLSTAHGRETCYIAVHMARGMPFERVLRRRRGDHGPASTGVRTGGSCTSRRAATLAPRYPEWDRFQRVRARLDPDGRFANAYLDRVLGASPRQRRDATTRLRGHAVPQEPLNDGEYVALDLRPHWWYFSKHILTGIPLLILWILQFRIDDGDVQGRRRAASLGVAHDRLGDLAAPEVHLVDAHVLRGHRPARRSTARACISRHGVEIPLERINNINFHQGIWERIIGAGDLEIQSAGEQGTTHVRERASPRRRAAGDLPPDGERRDARRRPRRRRGRQGRRRRARSSSGGGGGGGQTVPEQIEALARLRDQGHITPAEYEKKKAELLEKM